MAEPVTDTAHAVRLPYLQVLWTAPAARRVESQLHAAFDDRHLDARYQADVSRELAQPVAELEGDNADFAMRPIRPS